MKRPVLRGAFAALVLLSALAAAPGLAGQAASVQVKKAQVRAKPSFLGRVLADLAYGQAVQVRGERGAWKEVALAGADASGWMHASALTAKKVVLRPGQEDARAAAQGEEVALAGKGFNAQVEDAYALRSGAGYARVTAMEQAVAKSATMQRFLLDGLVFPPPDGAGGTP